MLAATLILYPDSLIKTWFWSLKILTLELYAKKFSQVKLSLLAATFLIDFMYFEESPDTDDWVLIDQAPLYSE